MPLNFIDYTINYLPSMLQGLKFTCMLFLVVFAIVLPLSTVVAILSISGPKWLKAVLSTYKWIFRGSPLLLQLYLAYFGLPYIGIVLPENAVVIATFVLCVTAYQSEVFRGGIISIEKGQYEACKVLGMPYWMTMWRVIIPQTVRRVLPQTCSQAIVVFKDTSLVATIGMFDLLKSARTLVIRDLRIDAFVVVLIVYLLISSIMVIVFDKLEKKYSNFV